MRRLGAIIFAVWASWCLSESAHAGKRVALVIGNSAYQNVPRLTNPANDASAIAAMLKKAGFDSVDFRFDLKAVEMRRALREFGNTTPDADVAVVYYAGHGIELDNANYLVPVDTLLETDTDIYDETTPLDRVLVAVEPAKQLRLIILDACRDNPFSKSMKRTVATRAIGRGLAKVEPTSPNTIIAFAAKAGFTASDGDGKNSPFALALAKHLATPGLDLRKAFGFVRDDVLKATGNKQEPYIYGSLGGDDVSLVPAKPVAPPPANPQADMRRDYELALQIGTRAVWVSFLNTYASGFYADLAKGQLDRIAAEEVRVAAVEKARLAQEEKARLAAEGAKQAEQARAAAQAQKAEEAMIAAEKAKQAEQAKAAAAEQTRIATEKAAAEKAAVMKAEADAAAERKRQAAEAAKRAEQAKAAAAEQARVAAEKAAAEKAAAMKAEAEAAAERKRQAAEKVAAEKAAAMKAEADAAAERKRQAAEAAKHAEQTKVAAAEQARVAAEKAAAEKAAATKAEADAAAERERQAAEAAKQAEQAKATAAGIATEKAAAENAEAGASPTNQQERTQVASLAAPGDSLPASMDANVLVRDIKKELQRTGCYTGKIDDKWVTAKISVGKFAKFAKLSAVPEQPDSDFLNAIRSRSGRVCPLECSPRQTESNGRCVTKSCPAGSVLDEDGSCEKRPSRTVTPSLDSGGTGREKSARGAAGDATKESLAIMPAGTIRTGEMMTLTARNGRKMTCTGGRMQGLNHTKRTCFWN
jgi:uncharacterized caspase-like protein